MAAFRVPGPVSGLNQTWEFDVGTLGLTLSPIPGPVCPLSYWPFAVPKPPKPKLDLSFLFMQCSSPTRGISDADHSIAAKKLGVDVATIKAVAKVETSGNAFDENGRPRILFERHYFHRFTHGKYDSKHKDISNKQGGGYGKFSAQYSKLERAYQLSPDAALSAASWGRFQIMGSNYKAAGFNSVRDFVLAMTRSEAEHLNAFANFVATNKVMLKALQDHDWAAFAAKYNGPKYKENSYDTKLKNEYERAKALQSKPSTVLP